MLAVLILPDSTESQGAPLPEGLYAGHSVASGSVRVPVVGRKETRTESFSLARVRSTPGVMFLSERGCAIEIGTIMGVEATMRKGTVGSLPKSTIRFERTAGGSWKSQPWTVAWGEEDLDGDGNPGATIGIRAPLCSGEVYVASETLCFAEGEVREGRLEGTFGMRVHQRILNASRRCLRWITSDSEDHLRGRFRYVPVPEETTCEDLLSGPWPGRISVDG